MTKDKLIAHLENNVDSQAMVTLQITDVTKDYAYTEETYRVDLILNLLVTNKLIPKRVFFKDGLQSIICYPRIDFIHENHLISIVLDYPPKNCFR